MDIDSPTGQQIYKSIERGHMVPIPSGFRDDDSGWHYHLTTMDYFVRRRPITGQMERIYVGMDVAVPIDTLDADEHIRMDSSATYDELLSPRTLPFNVKRNVRPGGRDAEALLAYCRSKHWVVEEHDPGKWPYFEKPFSRGVCSNMVQSVCDMQHAGWPVNHTRDTRTGLTYKTPDQAPPAYAPNPPAVYTSRRDATQAAQPPAMLDSPQDAVLTGAERRARRHARWAAEEAQRDLDDPTMGNLAAAFGAVVVVGGIAAVAAAAGYMVNKIARMARSHVN